MGSHTIPYTLAPHEATHVAGGSDDIDSALAIAAMADLTNGKAWKGNAGNRPAEVAWPAGGKIIATGSYAGNGTQDRQITTGFKCSLVFVLYGAEIYCGITIPDFSANFSGASIPDQLSLHATDGFVVGDATFKFNQSGITWHYFAISE